jgi:hypothetical protein
VALSPLNRALMACTKRAEKMEPDQLVETFVQDGTLFARLDSLDHQIFYGRRGTGKTHAMKYFAKTKIGEGRTVIYVDLQTIGSTGGLYSDPDLPLAEAGTRLLVDALADIHNQLLEYTIFESDLFDAEPLLPLLDELSAGLTEVTVRGEGEWQEREVTEGSRSSDKSLGLHLGLDGPTIDINARGRRLRASTNEVSRKMRGTTHHHVYFGDIAATMRRIVAALPRKQLWILLDEWAHVPLYLQPLLAEFIRRSLFPVPGLSVKIGAIEQRSRFMIEREHGGYVGIELGADAAADVDLDDFMVFGNDREQAIEFFASLLAQHAAVSTDVQFAWDSPQSFLDEAFANREAFAELVRACEGVPRDAINIVGSAAARARDRQIGQKDVRIAARAWYQRDKEKPVTEKPEAIALLHWIVDRVIGEKRSRGFLLSQDSRDHLIDFLYDERVLHIIRRGIASKTHAGIRFDAYTLDYGCYIDLLSTSKAPRGLFETTSDEFVEVPPDDADTIRGAVLRIQDFLDELSPLSSPSLDIAWIPREQDGTLAETPEAPGRRLRLDIEDEAAFIDVPIGRFLVGAARHNDIRLVHESVEDDHVVLESNVNELRVVCERDRRAYVNGRRIRSVQLADGDELRIGSISLTVIEMLEKRSLDAQNTADSA